MASIKPIGIIYTDINNQQEAPIQGVFAPTKLARIEIASEYSEGLKDIEGFSHLFLLFLFDRTTEGTLIKPMLLDDNPHGVFASRNPARPNRIGLTVVNLISRQGNVLSVQGVDMLNGTPLIDIKPYVPRFDSFPQATEGWLKGKENRVKPLGRGVA